MQMGRTRRSMELIEDRKERNVRFKRRYSGLKNKAKELSTLCAIQLCMVVFGPQQLEIWESDPNIIIDQDLFNTHRAQSAEEHRKINVGVSDYFEDRKTKSESKLESLRRKNNAAKFPDWHAKFDSFLETELIVEANILNKKIEHMNIKRDFMKEEDLGVLLNTTSYGSLIPQNHNQLQLMHNYLVGEEYPRPLAMIKPPSVVDTMMQMNNIQELGGHYPPQPTAMIRPQRGVDQMMPMFDYNFQEEYPQPIAMIRPPREDMMDYNLQQFGGEYYCNNFPDHQLNYDPMDPLMIRDPSLAQFLNDPPELDYTPLLTSSQIDSAGILDPPALPQSFYGTDMSSSMNSSQLLLPYYDFQGKNY